MIDNVVAALGLELDLTDEEIADVLWLAVQMKQCDVGLISERGDLNESLDENPPKSESIVSLGFRGLLLSVNTLKKQISLWRKNRKNEGDNKVIKGQSTQTPQPENFGLSPKIENSNLQNDYKQEPKVEVYSKNDRSDNTSTGRSDELQLRIPDARSLQKPLELARSLRPLMRRVPSHLHTLLDEEATVRRIAEEKIWVPVLRPALEPWLDLALVIDESASMLMWKHTIAELGHFLASYGVFRDVRIWKLGTDKAQKACIYAGVSADSENSAPRSPSELIEANGRCLVLVVSDCIAPIWHNGSMIPALQTWARSGMVAILQMLPDWLWGRTALNRGVVAKFSALTAGVPNYQLTTTTVSTWYDIDLETCIKIPVVTLEPEKFTAWAEMLAGKGGAWSAGIVFEPEVFLEPEPAITMEVASELDAEDRVHLFRLTASPIARRLAGLLAAAPSISLPIVRILQSKVLTQSQPVHVAEVFLGGLLKPLSEVTTKTNPNYLQYDFIEGVRDLLLESVPSSEIINVVAEVSDFIAGRLGFSLEKFAAVIRNPQQVENTEIANLNRPFALLTAQILKRLGGEYARFAEQLEQANIENKQIFDNISVKFDIEQFYQDLFHNIFCKTKWGMREQKKIISGFIGIITRLKTPSAFQIWSRRYNEYLRIFNDRKNSPDLNERQKFALEQDCYDRIRSYMSDYKEFSKHFLEWNSGISLELIVTEPIARLARDLWKFEKSYLNGCYEDTIDLGNFDPEQFYLGLINKIVYKTEKGLNEIKTSLLERSTYLKQKSLPQQTETPLLPREAFLIGEYREELAKYNQDLEVYNGAESIFNDRKNSPNPNEQKELALEQECYVEIGKKIKRWDIQKDANGRLILDDPTKRLLRDLSEFEKSYLNGDCIDALNRLYEIDAEYIYLTLIENINYKTEKGLKVIKESLLERNTYLKRKGLSLPQQTEIPLPPTRPVVSRGYSFMNEYRTEPDSYNQDLASYKSAERTFNDRKNSPDPNEQKKLALEQERYAKIEKEIIGADIQTEIPLPSPPRSVVSREFSLMNYRTELDRYNQDLASYKDAERIFNDRKNSPDPNEQKKLALEQERYAKIEKEIIGANIQKDANGQLIITAPIARLLRDLWFLWLYGEECTN